MTPQSPWSELPLPRRVAVADTVRPIGVDLVACWLMVGLVPCLWVRTSTRSDRFWWVAAIGVVGSVALVTAWRRSSGPRWPAVVLVAVCAVAFVGGPGTAVWTSTGGLVATWALSGRAPRWSRPPPVDGAPALVGIEVAVVVAAMQVVEDHATVGFGVPIVMVAVAVALAAVPAALSAIGRGVPAAARALAAAVVVVGVALIAIVVVLVPWLVQRVVRWDPTWAPRRDDRWVGRRPGPADATRMWSPDPRSAQSQLGRRAHAAAAVVAAAAIVGAVAGGVAWRSQIDAERAVAGSPALRGSTWWPATSRALDVSYGSASITSFVGVVMADVRSEGLNVDDGLRRTWRPPVPPECTPVTVWMFGGSTVFGEGQRDGHTIASELARAAWSDGVAVRVVNRGVPGDAHWMEVRRFELALAEGETPPDLAVFYDGTNDLRGQIDLDANGLGGQRLFGNDLDTRALRDVQRRNTRATRWLRVVRGGPEVPTTAASHQGEDAAARYAARGYAAAGRTGAAIADAAGVERVWFHQPSRASRRPHVPDDGPVGDGERRVAATFRSLLPGEVIDLAGALDDDPEPVYWDAVHTNEAGAAKVAGAMYAHLRDGLRQITTERGATCG